MKKYYYSNYSDFQFDGFIDVIKNGWVVLRVTLSSAYDPDSLVVSLNGTTYIGTPIGSNPVTAYDFHLDKFGIYTIDWTESGTSKSTTKEIDHVCLFEEDLSNY